LLIQGGQISRGRFSTVSVAGSYWMIWQISFCGDHLARRRRHVRADREFGHVGLAHLQIALAGLMSSASIFMPRTRFSPLEAMVSR
jgi:hypothetical protein